MVFSYTFPMGRVTRSNFSGAEEEPERKGVKKGSENNERSLVRLPPSPQQRSFRPRAVAVRAPVLSPTQRRRREESSAENAQDCGDARHLRPAEVRGVGRCRRNIEVWRRDLRAVTDEKTKKKP